MSRQRTIHPVIWSSEDFTSLDHAGRLLFIALFSLADDEGRGKAAPPLLAGTVFPGESRDVTSLLALMAGRGMVILYTADGYSYYQLTGWKKYQRPERPLPSRIPAPPRHKLSVSPHRRAHRALTDGLTEASPTGSPSGSPGPVVEVIDSPAVAVFTLRPSDSEAQIKPLPLSPLPPALPLPARTARRRPWPVEFAPWSVGFARFWDAYPRKASKGDAEKAWLTLHPTPEQLDVLLDAIEDQRQWPDWIRDGGKFIPYPASWLRAKGWENRLPETVPAGLLTDRTVHNLHLARAFVEKGSSDEARGPTTIHRRLDDPR